MKTHKIIILSCGPFEKDFILQVARAVSQEYQLPVEADEFHPDLEQFYSPGRRQYDGNRLLSDISMQRVNEGEKTAVLFRVDLFIPILTYIFGQAVLNGNAAIASVYRLRNEVYGLKKDDRLLLSRAAKEVIHELGHTFGLYHCHVPTCVMRSSTYVEDIDQKEEHLCPRCRAAYISRPE